MARRKKVPPTNPAELPLYLFHQGTNYKAYEYLGAHLTEKDGKKGVVFRTWAPRAESVSIVGDFNFWDCYANPMQKINNEGVYELFVEGLNEFDAYKYAVKRKGKIVFKADPYAFHAETPSKTASKVYNLDGYAWQDADYQKNKDFPYQKPVNIYEVNLASWKKHKDGSYYTYRELADELVQYAFDMGYTHLELMPVSEHPFDGSWGYQVSGYYAITSRYGTPKDFMYFVDCCHKKGLGVILDWVPAHFPKDEHGLYEFDGTSCYEYASPTKKENKGWGTRVFDWGRNEVKSFLISNAYFLFEKFHVDGLRVDAVASMLYLDYDRKDGEWVPNKFGGNYNLEAIEFFKQLNVTIFGGFPKAMMIAEESTAFPMITKPVDVGGLGFNFKWNMGWMNDSLEYMKADPYFRSGLHDKMTFSMCYAFSENYVLPISHDEVVHGKKSLLDKMPGDIQDKFSNLKVFNAYMYAHPGKKLTFMGNEYGQFKEWNNSEGLEFFMLKYDYHRKLHVFNRYLNQIYKNTPAFYEIEDSWDGFSWISVDERDNNVIAFERKDSRGKTVVVILNFSGNDYKNYRLGVEKGDYRTLLNTDSVRYGGRGYNKKGTYRTAKKSAHSREYSIVIDLPRFTGLYLVKSDK
ncbi:MAG: 1,4-alpha-glucan branching protein GlgB [Clostridia bacterium]|nr:1,4-alpha-glucan branching protein GlgB [Clostridia bacterium]